MSFYTVFIVRKSATKLGDTCPSSFGGVVPFVMSVSVRFQDAELVTMSLARVGNPLRKEPLQTSKRLCSIPSEDSELLTHCFLKSFRSLVLHHLSGEGEEGGNLLAEYATSIFEQNDNLLEFGAKIAKHLYSTSNHPNIKQGDLCTALINDVEVDGQAAQAISIIKSESKVPFLQISEEDGDLTLRTQHGIYPDKIDKGCLIINHGREKGYLVYLFDKSGNTQFWNREFVGAVPVKSDDYLTRRYTELCADFAKKGMDEDTESDARADMARKAVDYFHDAEQFEFGDFKTAALNDPEMEEQFDAFKTAFEEEDGVALDESFTVSKPVAEKAKKKADSRMRLDVGVEMRFSPQLLKVYDTFIEKAYDEEKRMNYVKVYYHQEV